jgi:hypothetical protein
MLLINLIQTIRFLKLISAPTMEVVCSSETLVYRKKTTLHNNPYLLESDLGFV